MVEISAETFSENCIHTITQLRKGKEPTLWIRIKDIGRKLDFKNIGHLVDKGIKGKFETNYPTEKQLETIKDMDQNLLKASNLFILIKIL